MHEALYRDGKDIELLTALQFRIIIVNLTSLGEHSETHTFSRFGMY